jgi:hypothetical protein
MYMNEPFLTVGLVPRMPPTECFPKDLRRLGMTRIA